MASSSSFANAAIDPRWKSRGNVKIRKTFALMASFNTGGSGAANVTVAISDTLKGCAGSRVSLVDADDDDESSHW